jgi:hypothetical protein
MPSDAAATREIHMAQYFCHIGRAARSPNKNPTKKVKQLNFKQICSST